MVLRLGRYPKALHCLSVGLLGSVASAWAAPQPEFIKVESLTGAAEAVDANGGLRQLTPGSAIAPGDKITTKGKTKLVLAVPNGAKVQVGPNSSLGVKVFQQVGRDPKAPTLTEANGYSLTSLQVDSGEVVIAAAHLNPASSVSLTGANGAKYYLGSDGACAMKRSGNTTEVLNLAGSGIYLANKDAKETYALKSQEVLVQVPGTKPQLVALTNAEFEQHIAGLGLTPSMQVAVDNLTGNRAGAPGLDDPNAPSVEEAVARMMNVLNQQASPVNQLINPSPTGG